MTRRLIRVIASLIAAAGIAFADGISPYKEKDLTHNDWLQLGGKVAGAVGVALMAALSEPPKNGEKEHAAE